MKTKINSSKNIFIRKNNYIGSLSNAQAMQFGELVSQVSKGTLKDTVRIYPRDGKDGKGEVQALVKYFGTKYPFSKIGWELSGKYVRYVLKDKAKRDSALNAMQLALNYYNTNRIKADDTGYNPLDELNKSSGSGTGSGSNSGSGSDSGNSGVSGSDDASEENSIVSFIKKPVNIVLIVALVVGVFFLFKK